MGERPKKHRTGFTVGRRRRLVINSENAKHNRSASNARNNAYDGEYSDGYGPPKRDDAQDAAAGGPSVRAEPRNCNRPSSSKASSSSRARNRGTASRRLRKKSRGPIFPEEQDEFLPPGGWMDTKRANAMLRSRYGVSARRSRNRRGSANAARLPKGDLDPNGKDDAEGEEVATARFCRRTPGRFRQPTSYHRQMARAVDAHWNRLLNPQPPPPIDENEALAALSGQLKRTQDQAYLDKPQFPALKWLCALCLRQSCSGQLGDLYGPYYIRFNHPLQESSLLMPPNQAPAPSTIISDSSAATVPNHGASADRSSPSPSTTRLNRVRERGRKRPHNITEQQQKQDEFEGRSPEPKHSEGKQHQQRLQMVSSDHSSLQFPSPQASVLVSAYSPLAVVIPAELLSSSSAMPVQSEQQPLVDSYAAGGATSETDQGSSVGTHNGSSDMVPVVLDVWLHGQCALWAPELFIVGGRIPFLDRALVRCYWLQFCSLCKKPGATVRVVRRQHCHNPYQDQQQQQQVEFMHYPCAIENNDYRLDESSLSCCTYK